MTAGSRSIALRPAGPPDVWAIRRLFAALHAYNTSLDPRFALAEGWEPLFDQHLERLWTAGAGLVVLAWRDTDPVGLIIMQAVDDSPLFRYRKWAELQAIYVDPSVRGSPVAAQLVAAGAAWAKEQGFDRIQLFMTTSNEPARRFYAHLGFRSVQEIWRLELGAPNEPLPDGLDRWTGDG